MSKEVKIIPIQVEILKVGIEGTTPYLPEPMDMDMVKEYDPKYKVRNKNKLSEEEKVKEKFYFTEDGKYGINLAGFYNGMIRGSTYFFEKSQGGQRNVREGVAVIGKIAPLTYSKITVEEHWGQTSGRTGSPRWILRNAFHDWETEITIQYISNFLNAELIINLLNYAGFMIGIGGFRKENRGNYGMYRVKKSR